MTTLLYIIGTLLLIIIVLIMISPSGYHVHRSIEVNKPLGEVFNYVKYLKNQDKWSPWKKKDPQMKQEMKGEDGSVGVIASWDGNKQVGSGEQEIVKIVENEMIESKLRFFKPWKSESDAYLKVEETSEGKTKVIWGFSGKNEFPSRIFMTFFNMDKTVGKDFEEGLNDLKEQLEQTK
ncbi:SRPBCC family protein [Flavobacteriaceae bacterium M23B6Z8]